MSHEDRVRLIRAPIVFTIIEPRCWAGCLIADPTLAQLKSRKSGEDESYIRYSQDDVNLVFEPGEFE